MKGLKGFKSTLWRIRESPSNLILPLIANGTNKEEVIETYLVKTNEIYVLMNIKSSYDHVHSLGSLANSKNT